MWRQVVLFIHLVAAVFWIGEMLVDAAVLGPAVRSLSDRAAVAELSNFMRARVGWLTSLTVATLVVTGIGNVLLLHLPFTQLAFYQTPFGRTLAYKVSVVALMILLRWFHTGVQYPALHRLRRQIAAAVPQDVPALEAAYKRYRLRAAWLGRAITALGLVVLFLAVRLLVTL